MEQLTNLGTKFAQQEATFLPETSRKLMSWYDEKEDKLICLECGLRSNQLGRHIVAKHDMTSAEYKKKFPRAKTAKLTDKQIQKMKTTKSKLSSKNKLEKLRKRQNVQDLQAAGANFIVCKLCEYQSMTSIISHITNKHKMKVKDYRDKFPNEIVQRMPLSQREKMEKVWTDPDRIQKLKNGRSYPSEIKHWINKGFTEDEAKEMVSSFQKLSAEKQRNSHTRKLQSDNTSGVKNPMSLVSLGSRLGLDPEDARKFTPAYGRKGTKHPMFGKHHTKETKQKIATNMRVVFGNRSKGEEDLANWLQSCGLSFRRNVGIDIYNCDIVLDDKKLILEYFGDFWHCNPKFWEADRYHSRMKLNASERWRRDQQKIQDLKSLGYNVMIIWEHSWKNDRPQIEKEILSAAN